MDAKFPTAECSWVAIFGLEIPSWNPGCCPLEPGVLSQLIRAASGAQPVHRAWLHGLNAGILSLCCVGGAIVDETCPPITVYGRDDVSGSPHLQADIVEEVRKGWRPHTPVGESGPYARAIF